MISGSIGSGPRGWDAFEQNATDSDDESFNGYPMEVRVDRNLLDALYICEWKRDEVDALSQEGFHRMEDMVLVTMETIETVSATIVKHGGERIPLKRMATTKVFLEWVKHQRQAGVGWYQMKFTKEKLEETLELQWCIEPEGMKEFTTPFKAKSYASWRRSFMEHLWSEKGCKGIPLAYVVVSQRPKTEPEDKPVKYDAVYSTKRTGVAYKQDRQRVWHLLQSNLT
ncbi:MAG: hypothetical protein AAFQ92_29940, partial [Bacteroidota bacterium]